MDGLPATLVEGVATTDGAGVPTGTSRFAYFVDVGTSGTVSLFTTGTADDAAYESQAGLVTLMAGASTFVSGTSGLAQERKRAISRSNSGSSATTAGSRSPKYSISTGVPGRAASAGSQA